MQVEADGEAIAQFGIVRRAVLDGVRRRRVARDDALLSKYVPRPIQRYVIIFIGARA